MISILFVTLSLLSCKKGGERNPDVVKYEEQHLELEMLEAELTELRIETTAAKMNPPKKNVKELRVKLEKIEEELKKVSMEVTELESSKEKLLKNLEDFKKTVGE